MANLLLYVESTQGAATVRCRATTAPRASLRCSQLSPSCGQAARMSAHIEGVVVHSLKACQNVMINDKHCFELYGYDVPHPTTAYYRECHCTAAGPRSCC